MLLADLPRVMAIEQSAHSYPWTQGMMQDCLRAGYGCQLLQEAGEPLGFAVSSRVVDELHLLNLCIEPRHQRKGLGRFLLCHLLAEGRAAEATTAFLEVRPSNQAARRLYQETGFCEVGYRKDYYPGGPKGRESALVMAMDLGVWHNPLSDE
jgi:ribosomal-protein-alanine N-acetyltransferase